MENETSKVEEISKNHQIFAKFCRKYHGKSPKCVQNVKKKCLPKPTGFPKCYGSDFLTAQT